MNKFQKIFGKKLGEMGMQPVNGMLVYFSRDFVLILFSTVAVCSTMLMSSVVRRRRKKREQKEKVFQRLARGLC